MKKFMALLLTLAMVSTMLCGLTVFAEAVAVTVAVDAGYEDLWADAAWDGTYLINNTGGYKFQVTLDGTNATLNMVSRQTITASVVCIPSRFTLSDGTTYNVVTLNRRLLNSIDSGNAGDVKAINNYIKKIVVSDGITTLNDAVFRDEGVLEEIVIPASVTSIGQYSFANNPKLTTVTFADGQNLTAFSSNLFDGCVGLTELEIPSAITSIGSYCFNNCSNLSEISVPSGITSISTGAFRNTAISSFEWPVSISNIPENCFASCLNLTTFTIPVGVMVVAGAFTGCENLDEMLVAEGHASYKLVDKAITDPTGTKLIMYTPGAETMVIPDSVTTINERAFQGCCITSINIPERFTSLPRYAFYNCPALDTVVVPGHVTIVDQYAFCSSSVKTVVFSEGVQRIESNAFRDCGSLEAVDFSKTITSIGDFAFYSCGKLTCLDVDATENVWDLTQIESIGKEAFYCNSLPGEIILGVTSVNSSIFRAAKFTRMVFKKPIVSMGTNVFFDMSGPLTVVFEQGPAPTYINSDWAGNSKTYTRCAEVNILYPDTAIDSFSASILADNVRTLSMRPFGGYIDTIVANETDGGYDVTYAVANYKEKNIGKAMIALYDTQGAMIGAKTVDATVGTTLTTVNVPANGTAASAKIFTLNSISELTPQYVNYEYVPAAEEVPAE